jgi:hypothetical protein
MVIFHVLSCWFVKLNKDNDSCRVGLAQLIKFSVVELTHPDSNSRFDMDVIFYG